MPVKDQVKLLESLSDSFVPLLDQKLLQDEYVALDLSVSNEELLRVDVSSSTALGAYVDIKLKQAKGLVGYGGYNERRNIYSRSVYFNQDNAINQRNIHLGIDLWCAAGTPVLAAHQGKIHSFKDNLNYGDYGPCIILEHQVEEYHFYTLYGHLSKASLESIHEDEPIEKGQRIGDLGTAMENGDYAPHLHFQVIMDMEGFRGDYPGVCNLMTLPHYLNNCPDPNSLLKIE